jgi:hypothetical protein
VPKTKCWNTKADAESALPLWLRNRGLVSVNKNYVHDRLKIGGAVRYRRKSVGMSLRCLAKWIGVSHTHLSNLELGQKPWSRERLQNVSDVLDMQERSQNGLDMQERSQKEFPPAPAGEKTKTETK